MADSGNTYQLQPMQDEMQEYMDNRFYPSRAKAIIEEVLNNKLKDTKYNGSHSEQITAQIARVVRSRLKELKIPRHKIAVQVIYGELKGQGMRIASRSLWDPNFDNWASYTFQNQTIHCTVIVFGVYFE